MNRRTALHRDSAGDFWGISGVLLSFVGDALVVGGDDLAGQVEADHGGQGRALRSAHGRVVGEVLGKRVGK